MSTRQRPRPRANTYTARLHQRQAALRRVVRRPEWRAARPLAASLALGMELGHLAAALTEWPAAAPRGLFHVLAAAAAGLLTVGVYFGRTRTELMLGAVLAAALPLAWLTGAAAGLSPYQDFPFLAAAVLSAVEVILAGLLAAQWRAFTTPVTRRR